VHLSSHSNPLTLTVSSISDFLEDFYSKYRLVQPILLKIMIDQKQIENMESFK